MEFKSLPTQVIFNLDKNFEYLNGINVPVLFLTILEYLSNHSIKDNIDTFSFLEKKLTFEEKRDLQIKITQYFNLF